MPTESWGGGEPEFSLSLFAIPPPRGPSASAPLQGEGGLGVGGFTGEGGLERQAAGWALPPEKEAAEARRVIQAGPWESRQRVSL